MNFRFSCRWVFATALGILSLVSFQGVAGAAAPQVDLIAPGIWRVRFGRPEKITPVAYRSAPANVDALKALPEGEQMPVALSGISFHATARGCDLTLPRGAGEHLYGLGLNTQRFEFTNRRAFIIPSDDPERGTNESHAPVPFYVSSAGYGVYVDTARFASFSMGDVDPVSSPADASAATQPALSVEELYKARYAPKKTVLVDIPAAHGVDVYLFAGPTPLAAVQRYNLFSGGGPVPPLWGLGITYRGQAQLTAEESLHLARSFRQEHIPCDQWGVEPGWETASYSSSFVWDRERFPEPAAFFSRMHALGFRVNVWEHAFIHPISPLYKPMRKFSGDYRVWNGLVPDFASAEGRRIFAEYQDHLLFEKGADGVKLDECDYQPFRSSRVWSFPEASRFPSGLDGEQMHSLFGVLYQQTMLGPLEKKNRRTWGLVRDSHALAAALPYTLYSDSYTHSCYIRGLAKCGFSGLLWTPEVRNAASLADLYRRVETVIFSPYALINCWYMRMPPWLQMDRKKNNAGIVMPAHAEATATIRRLFELRMSLVPYLYAAFNEYHRTGMPPIRALVLDFPADPQAALVDDEFMFGASLLVAPLTESRAQRSVYLPAGNWYDFWSGKRVAGGQRIDVSPPADQIPVFVRENSLVPLADPVEHVSDDTCFHVHVQVFGPRPEPFTLYEDDGVSNDFEKGAQSEWTLSWDGGRGHVTRAGEYHGPARYQIVDWSEPSTSGGSGH